MATLRRATTSRACAIHRSAPAHATHVVAIDRTAAHTTRTFVGGTGNVIRRSRGTAVRISLGTSQPPRQRNHFCGGYIAQHVDTGREARSAHPRETRD